MKIFQTGVNFQQWSAYRSARNFRNPESFAPERWLNDPHYADDNKAVFHPFHIGPRNCVGMKYENSLLPHLHALSFSLSRYLFL